MFLPHRKQGDQFIPLANSKSNVDNIFTYRGGAVDPSEIDETDLTHLFKDRANRDYSPPTSNFTGLDKGVTLGSPYNFDILGIPRPQGPAWDIGAYEYVQGGIGILYGDVSGDGVVSAYDAALVAQAAVGLISFTSDQLKAGDVSGDGAISAYDAALIAQRAVGLISKFPVEG